MCNGDSSERQALCAQDLNQKSVRSSTLGWDMIIATSYVANYSYCNYNGKGQG